MCAATEELLFRCDGLLQGVNELAGGLVRILTAGGVGDSGGCFCEASSHLLDTEAEFVNPACDAFKFRSPERQFQDVLIALVEEFAFLEFLNSDLSDQRGNRNEPSELSSSPGDSQSAGGQRAPAKDRCCCALSGCAAQRADGRTRACCTERGCDAVQTGDHHRARRDTHEASGRIGIGGLVWWPVARRAYRDSMSRDRLFDFSVGVLNGDCSCLG